MSCNPIGFRFLLVMLLGLAACQMKPTKVGESQQREFQTVIEKTTKPIVLTEDTVVLDARSAFDYGLNRVQGSLRFGWEDLAENATTGEVLRDTHQAALRLSLLGVTPTTPVVVVGNGAGGVGEEGRLAWTLLYLGFRDVQIGRFDAFRKDWTQALTPPPKNVPVWTPVIHDDLAVSKPEFVALMKDAKGRFEKHIWIIDVRSEHEYFNKDRASQSKPDIGAVHIEWKEFFNDKGRPNGALRKKLEALGIQPQHRVIVISKRGVRSGAAAYALLALGYRHVQNFTDGWRSL